MTTSDPLQSKKDFYADFVYKYLISLTRAEDVSLTFYGITPQSQKETEIMLKNAAVEVANSIVEDWSKISNGGKKQLTEEQKKKLIAKGLELAQEKYNENKGN